MQALIRTLALTLFFGAAAATSGAETATLDITVTYHERIALPPDAEVDVQLMDLSQSARADKRIASGRFVMDAVPMTVRLHHDAQLATDGARYGIRATIWSGNQPVFATQLPVPSLDAATQGVEVTLQMVDDAASDSRLPRSITGLAWAVTEVSGTPWPNDQ